MFTKKAVVLTNAIGIFNGGALKDMVTSLRWLGVSDIKKLGVGLLEGVVWKQLSQKRQRTIVQKAQRLARRYLSNNPARKGTKVRVFFAITRMMHQGIARKEEPLSADNQYWLDKGWIRL